MLILIIPKTLILMKINRRREIRMPVQRGSIIRWAKETMVSVKRIIPIWWLTPMCRVICSVVGVNRPSAVEE